MDVDPARLGGLLALSELNMSFKAPLRSRDRVQGAPLSTVTQLRVCLTYLAYDLAAIRGSIRSKRSHLLLSVDTLPSQGCCAYDTAQQ